MKKLLQSVLLSCCVAGALGFFVGCSQDVVCEAGEVTEAEGTLEPAMDVVDEDADVVVPGIYKSPYVGMGIGTLPVRHQPKQP